MASKESETEVYTCAIDIFQRQREMYWTRNSIVIFLQGILASALTISELNPVFVIIFGFFGASFSIVWAYILYKAYHTINWWKNTILSLEQNLEDDRCLIGIYSEQTDIDGEQPEGFLHLSKFQLPIDFPIPILTGVFWTLIFLYGVFLTI